MRVPRIPTLLLAATCCLSGCASFNGNVPTDHAWVGQKGDVIQQGHVHQKGHVGHPHQKGVIQKGVAQKGSYKSIMHQNLWNRYESTACCESWDPVLGSCHACGVCGGDCEGHTPAQHLKHKLTCASGCGELYWGEWISDPPVACDPCDDWGNWTGPTDCSGPSCVETVASGFCNLWGFRNGGGKGKGGCESCGGKGGCDSCGVGSAEPYYDQTPMTVDDEVVPTPEIEAVHPAPRGGTGLRIRSARFSR